MGSWKTNVSLWQQFSFWGVLMAGEVKIWMPSFNMFTNWPSKRTLRFIKKMWNMASLIASQNVTSVLSHIAGMKSISLIHCCSFQLRKNTHLEAWCVYVAESEKTKLYSYRIQPSRQISSSCLRLKPSSTPDVPIQQCWWPTGQPIAPWGARSGSASTCVELSSGERWRDPCSAHLAARSVV